MSLPFCKPACHVERSAPWFWARGVETPLFAPEILGSIGALRLAALGGRSLRVTIRAISKKVSDIRRPAGSHVGVLARIVLAPQSSRVSSLVSNVSKNPKPFHHRGHRGTPRKNRNKKNNLG